MGDDTRRHSHQQQRHTAKSDQRFDASRRVKLSTFNGDNAREETKNTEAEEKADKNEKGDKFNEEFDETCLHPKDEIKILKHWGLLKKTLIIAHVIDPLIEKGIITPEKWMKLKRSQKSDQDAVEEFLYVLLKSHHDAYELFLKALKSRGYSHVASQLEGQGTEDNSATVSVSSGGSNQNRQIGRPPTVSRIFPRQSASVVITDPRNGATAESRNVNVAPTAEHGAAVFGSGNIRNNSVKQEDLYRMKEEITGELRQLRENMEKDRDQDRLELQILQRKHSELKDDLTKTKCDREQLQSELTFVTETVKVLKAQIEQKQFEYRQVKERNQRLEEKLDTRSGHLEKLIHEKEKEKNDLVNALKTKDDEYKQLQNMLERLKGEHEERHARLKGLTRDKVTLEKEVQLLNKEKKNLEVKIRSLEQHIRVLQESHTRETGDIKQELEKQKTVLEEMERERINLEKKLEESVRENENLKKTNSNLEVNLQKTQDEKAHLQQKLHKADMTKYVLPPFLAGSKSTRTGWNPKNLRRQ